MDKTSQAASSKRVTLPTRVEDLEDLQDLNEAIARNKGKPGIPWEKVKKDLGLG
jgi:phenylalanyl-tRNA synthetase beta subunit